MKWIRGALDNTMIKLPLPTETVLQGLCFDKDYDFVEVRAILREFGFTAHLRARGEEAKAPKSKQASGRASGWWNALIAG